MSEIDWAQRGRTATERSVLAQDTSGLCPIFSGICGFCVMSPARQMRSRPGGYYAYN